jgi:hypothetical protein
VISTDQSSAFQRVQRSCIERELFRDEKLRPLLPYFWSLYADPSRLYYGENFSFSSTEGTQQGCSGGTGF